MMEEAALVPAVPTAPSVPIRALALSLAALGVAVVAALFSPDELLDQQILAGLLALIPALLLAHYRRWQAVSILLVVGMVILSAAQVISTVFGLSIQGTPVVLVVIAPYIAIALGAGWFAEVRNYAAEQELAGETLRRLEKALETMQLGVVITDVPGRIVYANPADARMHGFTVDELIGQDIGIYAPPGTRNQLKRTSS
jgi:PAS domain-containing protein